MNPALFVQNYFGAGSTTFDNLSNGTKRIAWRSRRVFDAFMASLFTGQDIVMEHLVAFMLYRVVGRPGSSDEHAGACSLDTFMHGELGPLIHSLRHEGKVLFTFDELQQSQMYRECVSKIRGELSERPCHTHARAIYPCDEERLLACLTLDTLSTRDRALIVLLSRTGSRPATVALIRRSIHIIDSTTHLTIMLPGVKTNNAVVAQAVLQGKDADYMRKWIRCREAVLSEIDFLFVSSNGSKLTCDMVTRLMSQLSVCAGYGEGFFTAQSFRVGFANTIAAEVYSQGGTLRDVHETLYSGHQWKKDSKAVSHYIDPNLPNFFKRGLNLSFDQFMNLSPSQVHKLSDMPDAVVRPLLWFCHSPSRIISIHEKFNIVVTSSDQRVQRIDIGFELMRRCDRFRQFIDSCVNECGKSVQSILSDAIGCLLEDYVIDLYKWLSDSVREKWLRALVTEKYPVSCNLRTTVVQRSQIHQLRHRDQTEVLLNCLTKRKYDRKLHLGRLPDSDQLVVLKVRDSEKHCHEPSQLPLIDIDSAFPRSPSSNSSDDNDVRPPTPPPCRNQNTPSTSASSRYFSTPRRCT